MHVRFEQGKTHFAHCGIHIFFREFSTFTELVKDLVES
jgi:hypothetical protein